MQNYIKTIINAIKTWISGKIKDSAADWNQNDPNADNYVKNRTHWEEYANVSYIAECAVVPNQPTSEGWYYLYTASTPVKMPQIGEKYVVVFDGIEYEEVARDVEGGICFGKELPYAFDGPDKPYGIFIHIASRVITVSAPTNDKHTFKVYRYEEVVHKLDEKYLPDNTATVEQVEAVQDTADAALTTAKKCADWDESDENAVSFVKNRTHYATYTRSDSSFTTTAHWAYVTARAWAYKDSSADNYYIARSLVLYTDDVTVRIGMNTLSAVNFEGIDESGNYTFSVYYGGLNATFEITVDANFSRVGFHNTYRSDLSGVYIDCPRVIKKFTPLSDEYIPDTIARTESVLNATDPVGTGSFSMNRASGTTVGTNSSTLGYNTTASGENSHAEGYGTVATTYAQNASGTYNIAEDAFISEKRWHDLSEGATKTVTINSDNVFYISKEFIFDSHTGQYSLVNPISVQGKVFAQNIEQYADYYIPMSFASNTQFSGKAEADITSFTSLLCIVPNSITASYYNMYTYRLYVHGSKGQFALGRLSQANTRTNYAHIVGNGTSDTERSNAHTLDWEGNAWYSGDVYVGSTSGTNKDEGSKKLATEEYVDSHIVQSDFSQNDPNATDYVKNRTHFARQIYSDNYIDYFDVNPQEVGMGLFPLVTPKEGRENFDFEEFFNPDFLQREYTSNGKRMKFAINITIKNSTTNSSSYLTTTSTFLNSRTFIDDKNFMVTLNSANGLDLYAICDTSTLIGDYKDMFTQKGVYLHITKEPTITSGYYVSSVSFNVFEYTPFDERYLPLHVPRVDSKSSVGQAVVIKAVNSAGKPTEWEAADFPTPDVSGQINTHNTATDAHNDIRLLVEGLTTRLNTVADSDDTTLDQLSEIVTYIKANKELIGAITTSKVNVSDIIDNLTTNVSNRPLSAAQGVALKALIDAISVPTKTSDLTNDSGYLTSYTETDPTVPAWAKAANKPTYTASEVGAPTIAEMNAAIAAIPTPEISTITIAEIDEICGASIYTASEVTF